MLTYEGTKAVYGFLIYYGEKLHTVLCYLLESEPEHTHQYMNVRYIEL